ncbi:serine hydrolase [Nocardioides sp. KR10-350]|uniref:serine hydrolase n=1 Tax=Nocardioides cheoyonin TaxID=3156615 RepID=UPI0032B4B2B8
MDGALVSTWVSGLDGVPLQAQNVNQQHYAASLIKVPIAIAAYRLSERGELDLDEKVPVHVGFDSQVEGARFTMDEGDDQDPETWGAVGGELPLRDLVRRSLTHSGNLASNLVLERVGAAEVAEVLAESHCSPMTQIPRGIEDAPAREAGLQNLVTAHDMARVLIALAEGRLASPESSAELEGILRDQVYRDAIPLALPEDVVVGNKTGWIEGVRHDIALVRAADRDPLVMCVLTTGLDDDESEFRISELARYLWDSLG